MARKRALSVLHWSHAIPCHPGAHPIGHCPVSILHGAPSLQLHVLLQLFPKCPCKHAAQKMCCIIINERHILKIQKGGRSNLKQDIVLKR